MKSLSCVWLCVTPLTVACQAPLTMGFFQARILEWVAISFSRGSSQPRGRTRVSCTAGRLFTIWATREAHASMVMLKTLQVGFSIMWTENFQMFKLGLEKTEEPEIKLPTFTGSTESKGIPEKHLPLFRWLCQSLWPCGSQQTVENSKRDGNTKPSYLSPEKLVCGSRSNS